MFSLFVNQAILWQSSPAHYLTLRCTANSIAICILNRHCTLKIISKAQHKYQFSNMHMHKYECKWNHYTPISTRIRCNTNGKIKWICVVSNSAMFLLTAHTRRGSNIFYKSETPSFLPLILFCNCIFVTHMFWQCLWWKRLGKNTTCIEACRLCCWQFNNIGTFLFLYLLRRSFVPKNRR